MSRIVVAPFLAGALLVPLAVPAGAAGPAGATTRVTFGQAFGAYSYPLVAGKQFAIQRHVLDPGEIVRWKGAGTTVAIHHNREGSLTNYPSCTSKQTWRGFPAYYVVRSAAEGTLTGVTVNTTEQQVELFTFVSEAVGEPQTSEQLHRHAPEGNAALLGEDAAEAEGVVVDPVEKAKGCPTGPEGETTVLAAGEMADDAAIELEDHNLIAVHLHSVPPGYNSGWQSPISPTLIVPISGEFTSQSECDDVTARKAGQAFLAGEPSLVKNAGSGPAEYLAIMWNIPNGMPFDVPPYVPDLPPTACPASALPF